MMGVGVCGRPVTTRMVNARSRPSTACRLNPGMLTRTCVFPRSSGRRLHRSMFSAICAMRPSTGMLSAAIVLGPTTPSTVSPCRA